ncbi:hypothetical protein [Phenylobacterium sp.]|jgi:hypothetical protein|uniref:hypothetical protein n=1 Tax=Phenylobacterium sp. TaxID=1871053 RepID=UPI002F95E9AB
MQRPAPEDTGDSRESPERLPQRVVVRPEDVVLGAERSRLRPSRLEETLARFVAASSIAVATLLLIWLTIALAARMG